MNFAVVGDPVAHSLSPTIHSTAIADLGLPHTYAAIRIAAGGFGEVARSLVARSLDGVNVTMPLKGEAFEAAQVHSEGAERTRSVNTVTVIGSNLVGDNTDIDGVLYAVDRLGTDPEAPVTVLGTGGAARAAIVALGDRRLTVMARTPEKAAAALEATATTGRVARWGESVVPGLVVNATPVGMGQSHGTLPASLLETAVGLVDMVYGHGTTPAVEAMRSTGRPAADGLDMLVGQAVRAFTLFTGEHPPVEAMIRAARNASS